MTLSNYDLIIQQLAVLKGLNETFAGAQSGALTDFQLYKSRIESKVQEVNQALSNLTSTLSSLNSGLSGYTSWGGIRTDALNLAETPNYDFSAAIANQTLAMQAQQNVRLLNSTFMFNSAIESANAGTVYATAGMNSLGVEEAIPRQFYWSTELVALVLVMVVMGLAGIILVSRRRPYYG